MIKPIRTLPSDFFQKYWQRQPILLREHVREFAAGTNWIRRARGWCRSSSAARLFTLQDEIEVGRSRAARVPSAASAYRLFTEYAAANETLTLLLNNVETAAPELESLRTAFGVGRSWRHDDIVATLSSNGSGIGFHAGHEDGFIVQLAGRRNWLLWKPSVLPKEYRLCLLGDPRYQSQSSPGRPSRPPDYEYNLDEGDVLYLPALFGHEGRTLALSVSLSIGWRGLNAWRLLIETLGKLPTLEMKHESLFDLIPDPPTEKNLYAHFSRRVLTAAKQVGLNDIQMELVARSLEARFQAP
jgi:ribosomal protein L16 Arg81 hydroxylase